MLLLWIGVASDWFPRREAKSGAPEWDRHPFLMTDFATSPVRRSILIVEDEAMIGMMLEEFIDTLGHHVRGVASTVGQALEIVRDGGFDLAILDCNLGGEEAWPVADALDQAGIPFILSSGGSLSDVPELYADRQMLAKPYTIGTISDVLAACEAMRG